MARLSEIESFGQFLQESPELQSLTTTQLYKMLKRYTHSFTRDVLSGYIKLLKEQGVIEFENDGRWHIIKKNKTLF